MDTEEAFLVALSGVAAAIGVALAVVVLATGPGRGLNRRLAAVLAADALFMVVIATGGSVADYATHERISYAAMLVMVVAYLVFVSMLDTPVSAVMRRRAVQVVMWTVVLGVFVVNEVLWRRGMATGLSAEAADPGLPWPLIGAVSLLALVVTWVAYRRAPAGTPSRRRAAYFALAFGVRDALQIATVAGWAILNATGQVEWRDRTPFVAAFGAMLFPLLLAYGILSTQLFDIDIKIKRGISRSTVATIGIIAVFVAAKVAEQYLSQTLGFVAGAMAAGVMLFAVPRLNKIGDKVANAAMPQVQPTSDYVAFKKLEVYRAAVESALEGDGLLSSPERAMLDRLRGKLGLAPGDAQAIEAELAVAAPTRPVATA